MQRECEETLKQIINGFRECRNAFTAIGDETRQLTSNKAICFSSSADFKRS